MVEVAELLLLVLWDQPQAVQAALLVLELLQVTLGQLVRSVVLYHWQQVLMQLNVQNLVVLVVVGLLQHQQQESVVVLCTVEVEVVLAAAEQLQLQQHCLLLEEVVAYLQPEPVVLLDQMVQLQQTVAQAVQVQLATLLSVVRAVVAVAQHY